MTKRVLIFFLVAFTALEVIMIFSRNILDDGGFYAKEAQIIIKHRKIERFPWLTATFLENNYAGIHGLFPYLLIPFVALMGPMLGAQSATALFFAALLTLSFYIFERKGIGLTTLWVLVLVFGSVNFTSRMIFTRPLALSVFFILAATYFISEKKYLWLLASAAALAWVFDGYVIIIPVLMCAFFSRLIAEHKTDFKIFIALAGIAAALIFNPYFPLNLKAPNMLSFVGYIRHQTAPIAEWQNFNLADLLSSNVIVLCIWIFSIYWAARKFLHNRKIPQIGTFELTALSCSVIYFLLSLFYKRFNDYWVPFAILFSALSINDLTTTACEKIRNKTTPKILMMINYTAGIIAIIMIINASKIYEIDFKTARKIGDYQEVSEKIMSLSKPGQIIYNAEWDQFPQLFFWNSQNYYVGGLNPLFMYSKDAKKYEIYKNIAGGNLGTEPLVQIKENFGAGFIVLHNRRNSVFRAYLDRQIKQAKKIYENDELTAYMLF